LAETNFEEFEKQIEKALKPYDLGIWRMKPNPLKKLIKSRQLVLGLEQRWFTHGLDMNFMGYTAHAGYDFIVIDTEHTPWYGLEGCVTAMIAAEAHGIVPNIRISGPFEPILVTKALEIGAYGVWVPHVNTAEDARKMVAAAKFNIPGWEFGERGVSVDMRFDGYGRTPELVGPEIFQRFCNENTMVTLLALESREAMENFEEIISVPGVDMISLSTGDIAQCLGYPRQHMHPEVLKKRDWALELCQEKGMPVYLPAGPLRPEYVKYYWDKGVHIFHANLFGPVRIACYDTVAKMRDICK
jgi:4-hydroxy-2-oxoheptanedioate aldolase